jgi:glycopeptide antibiotics resistance protein
MYHSTKQSCEGLAIYNRSLAPAEIARNCARWQRRGFPELENGDGLAALYFFNEAGARTIQDHSPARNALELPPIYRILRKTVLLPMREDSPHILDISVNILGFIPFGFFYFLYRASTRPNSTTGNILLTVLAAAILSTAIELIQVYLTTRYSQAADIVCNISGAVLGIILAALALRSNFILGCGYAAPRSR